MTRSILPHLTPDRVERFWSKVLILGFDDCWDWQGAKDPNGYGRFMIGMIDGVRLSVLAHRFAYVAATGDEPAGLHICHKCDFPGCNNPSHFFKGDDALNMADCKAKGRQSRGERASVAVKAAIPRGDAHYLRCNPGLRSGERNPMARLTTEQVAEIRALFAAGVHRQDLARQFDVTASYINELARGRRRSGA